MKWLVRHTTVISLLFAGGLAGVLFSLKYEVQALEEELQSINRSVASDRETIHVLEAEWSLLNDPKRLEDLSHRYLDLTPMDPGQFGTVSGLPPRPVDAIEDAGAHAEARPGLIPLLPERRGGAQ